MPTLLLSPSPSFTLGPLQADGQRLTLTSTSTFPPDFPRSNYALYVRVNRVDTPESVLVQPLGNPLLDNSFPVVLPDDGVYDIRLVAFPKQALDLALGGRLGSVFYDTTAGRLTRLEEKQGRLVGTAVELAQVLRSQLPFSSASRVYVQLTPAKALRDELVGKLLDLQLSGKRASNREQARQLRDDIQDMSLAIRGVENETRAGRAVEAQRHLRLLGKLRLDCCC